MKERFMLILKLLLLFVIVFGSYLILTILYAYITDYKPKAEELAEVLKADEEIPLNKDSLTIYAWNIGYCGLGAESNFFYDGGEMVRSSRELVNKNFSGVKETILEWKEKKADFILLQEIDVDSRRSWGINQLQGIKNLLGYTAVFGKNYDVNYIPIPLYNPMGGVLGGIATFSPYKMDSDPIRYQFPANFAFPKSLFFLDRCFTKQSFALNNGKKLIIINTHNSAYDGGKLKKQEMEYFKKYILEEYNAGNYVIVGGDWNQIPPGYTPKDVNSGYEETPVPDNYVPSNWTWAYDKSTATNRKVDKAYKKGETYTTIIDFFLLSPNVRLNEIKGIVNDFAYSDHQPIKMVCTLVK